MSFLNFGDIGDAGQSIGTTTRTITEEMKHLPVGEMILTMATGIADAQSALDLKGIEQFKLLASTKVNIGDQERTMLQLGFLPHFYFFQKATFEISLTLTFKV